MKLQKKRLSPDKLFVTVQDQCPNGFVPIFQERGVGDFAAEFIAHGGQGSNIDADFLDGKNSSDFASANALSDLKNATIEIATDLDSLFSGTVQLRDAIERIDARTAPRRVITVAKDGGDFQNLQQALQSINNPSEQSPYLVSLAPGLYQIPSGIEIPSGVMVRGSGRGITVLQGAVSSATVLGGALLRLGQGAVLANLTVQNSPAQGLGLAILVKDGAQASLDDVSTFRTTIRECDILANGSTALSQFAVVLDGASLQILSSNISVGSSSSVSRGISLIGGLNSRLRIISGSIYAEGSSSGEGIEILSPGGQAQLDGVRIYGSSTALSDSLGLVAEIRNSTLKSLGTGLLAAGPLSRFRIFHTGFDAADHVITIPPADVVCAFASNLDTGEGYTSSCE